MSKPSWTLRSGRRRALVTDVSLRPSVSPKQVATIHNAALVGLGRTARRVTRSKLKRWTDRAGSDRMNLPVHESSGTMGL